MNILFVLRDIMPARMTIPVIKQLLQKGHNVDVAAEGKAIGICKENGISPFIEGGDERKPLDRDFWLIFQSYRFDIVCIGCSSPINWELEAAQAAQEDNIPVIAFSDIWGALSRLQGFVPDAAFVMDNVAVSLEPNGAKQFFTIGDIASETAKNATANASHLRWMNVLHASGLQTVLVVGDGNDVVEDMCLAVGDSIYRSTNRKKYVVIPRLIHPKQASDPVVGAVVDRCMKNFNGIAVEDFTHPDRASTDWLATQATITVAAFSTPIRTALHAGRLAASIYTSKCLDSMEAETKIRGYPLVDAGVVPKLMYGLAMDYIIAGSSSLEIARHKWTRSAKFRPEKAVEVIESFGV